ncbi:formate dehydrogenase major subunit [Syntrophus gentianae]|uniref:Formate dehydrogenase major subunit n=1 Tax=Syntrophus gentianae TaxID=43775 RepID=A0A1H7WAS4_9BACT|nr:molybdopterin-dependent oxidoreductase [Syntrophus gentianae]SEM18580.1 formate dehydrogenase major subunit [Syntrophus gentianae]
MVKIRSIINGSEVFAPPGATIFEAAQQAGIDIPTLCHHRKLHPIGACRICVVEIKGQRSLQTACTFPVAEGMEIETESPRVVSARKFILGMLFSERNHLCPFCEASGDCELQNLGYRYGIDHWFYPTFTKPFPLDASRGYFIMNHNRCVLCQRCARACNELVANHTLGLRQRGADSMINCDANLPYVKSTCISCGTCLQICPTGALSDPRSSFMGRDAQTERTRSICNKCSVGCGTSIVTRAGNVLRIEGDWDAPVNGGLLCKMGRFEPLYDQRKRTTQPMLRRQGKLEPVTWEEALQGIADHINKADAKEVGLLVSGDATNEALYLASRLFKEQLSAANVGLLSGAVPDLFDEKPGAFSTLSESDLILLIGADPAKDQPVSSFMVKRLVDKGVRLIVVDDGENGLRPFADATFKSGDLAGAIEIADRVESVAVLYGTGLTAEAAQSLKKLGAKARFVALEPGVNSRAAAKFGLNNGFQASTAKVLYALLGEQDQGGDDVLAKVDKEAFVIVQAGYAFPLLNRADVVLPSAIWSERTGSLTNTEGSVQMAAKAVEPAGEARPDWEILSLLADRLGKNLGASFAEISACAAKELE